MTNKFRITKKKDGTVSYHMEGSSDFINSISDKILNSKKASKSYANHLNNINQLIII